MHILLAALAFSAGQPAPAAPADQPQPVAAHAQKQHDKHGGEDKSCEKVDGKMECRMMKSHGADAGAQDNGHSGH